MAAALAGDRAALQAALDAGEDIDAWNDVGLTPLLMAVFNGDVGVVRLLLEAGANPNKPARSGASDTPLWHAEHDFGRPRSRRCSKARARGTNSPAAPAEVRNPSRRGRVGAPVGCPQAMQRAAQPPAINELWNAGDPLGMAIITTCSSSIVIEQRVAI